MASSKQIKSSEIRQFFKGRSIFITGGTGFYGQALLEKLLRSCSDIDKIFLLIRDKKGKASSQRFDEITNSKLFETVTKTHPNFKSKLVGIRGNLSEPSLGISNEDRIKLIKSVNVIFHAAATIKFDEPLKVAVNMNVVGLKNVIDLCKSIENLDSLVHISTAYANCDIPYISEKVYDPPMDPKKLIGVCDLLSDDLLNQLTPKLIQPRPNTYTFTKAIAESLIVKECENQLPCAIIRPSIIGASWQEPFPGWIDTGIGSTILISASGTGELRTMLGDRKIIKDIVPLDITVNVAIAAAWFTANKSRNKINVYNCTSGNIRKFTWGDFENFVDDSFNRNPLERIFLKPDFHFTLNKYFHYARLMLGQYMPAYIYDFYLKLTNQKPIFVKRQKKMNEVADQISYFTSRQWEFSNENLFSLMKELNETDSKEFNFDISNIDWKAYIEKYCLGIKEHVFKEDLSKMNECRKKMTRMKVKRRLIYMGVVALMVSTTWYSIYA